MPFGQIAGVRGQKLGLAPSHLRVFFCNPRRSFDGNALAIAEPTDVGPVGREALGSPGRRVGDRARGGAAVEGRVHFDGVEVLRVERHVVG